MNAKKHNNERAALVAELDAANESLASIDAEIVTAEATSDAASAVLGDVAVADAAGLIQQRNAANDLLASYLRPQREKLATAVKEAQARIDHLDTQARADRTAAEHDVCVGKLNEAVTDLRQDLVMASLHALEVNKLSTEYTRINEAMNSLVHQGCAMSTTVQITNPVGLRALLAQWKATGALMDWEPTIEFLNRSERNN